METEIGNLIVIALPRTLNKVRRLDADVNSSASLANKS